jgi:hypothetical protein
MINIWFGLDAGGFEKARELISEIYTGSYSLAADFDRIFGPILMVTYACLSNTLLLTGMSPYTPKLLGQCKLYPRSLGLGAFVSSLLGLYLMAPWQILSHTFSTISEDAAAEVELSCLVSCHCTKSVCRLCLDELCRRLRGWSSVHILLCNMANSVFCSVKADSLFSYQPPVNLLALCVLLPSSYVLTPRWFHKVWFSNYLL